MSEISESIDAVISQGLSALMKSSGFKKSGRNWHRKFPDGWQVVNVQASSGNVGSVGKFTINLGIYSAPVAEDVGAEIDGMPKEYQTTLRERLGFLAKGCDYWWEINQKSDISEISLEVVRLMNSHGFPWLESHTSMHALAEALKEQSTLYSISAAYLSLGKEEALQRLRKAIAERPAARSGFLSWANEHGLEP